MSTARVRRSSVLSVLAVCATSSLVLAGCASDPSTPSSGSSTAPKDLPKTIAFSPLSLQPPALKGLSVALGQIAKGAGWKVLVQDPNFDAAKQTQQISEVLASGRAGAIWTLAVSPKSMGGTIKAAQAKGVPILVNGKPEEYGYSGAQPGVTFDYVDYTAAGNALGDQLGTCLSERNDGKGDVLFAKSSAGQAGKAEFEAAAEKALTAAAPGAKVVQALEVKDRSGGQTDIGNALQAHSDLAGVMSSTDEGALGAQGAFDAAGKKLICNADFGGNEEVLKDVASGDIYSSVALQFGADTKQAFDTLVKMQGDPKAKGPVLVVPQKIIASGS